MAKKADLLAEAKELKLSVTEKNTIAEIEAAIKSASQQVDKAASVDKEVVAEREAVVAKAGKRSQKSLDEAEEKAEKEARKEAGDTTPQDEDAEAHVKKGPKPVTRPKLERRGKKYRELAKQVDATKVYSLDEALDLATKTSPTKFDASVEVHVRLGVDPRQADQNVRATVALPHGTGKNVRVAVFAKGPKAEEAKKAGADVVGDEELSAMIQKGDMPFERVIATPDMMAVVGKLGQILGPKGLMPNPKLGTVTMDVTGAVKAAKGGSVEFRAQKEGIVHVGVGKVNFDDQKLVENVRALVDALVKAKPATSKGVYLKKASLSSTMGPGVKLDISSLTAA